MATEPRVPGAASSEVDFELDSFELVGSERIEVCGRWYGLRGRRIVRPVLKVTLQDNARRRVIALLEHKPWAADDGQPWIAAFAWKGGIGEVSSAILEVGPGLIVDLPAPGNPQGRVRALRPHAPAPTARLNHEGAAPRSPGEQTEQRVVQRSPEQSARANARIRRSSALPWRDTGYEPERSWELPDPSDKWERRPVSREPAPRRAQPPRDLVNAAIDERDEATAARDRAERERVRALSERDDAFSRRDAALRDVERAVSERDDAVAERDRAKADLEHMTRERDVAHAERNRMMQDSEAVARQRDQAAAERDGARHELARALPERESAQKESELSLERALRAESERDKAIAERKAAVAQRDRARRERDRAMRAAGIDPPADSPFIDSAPLPARSSGDAGSNDVQPKVAVRAPQPAPGGDSASAASDERPAKAGDALPTRPLKRIGSTPTGPLPEPKPLLTPVDSGKPRRLSRNRRPPSASVRWAFRVCALLVVIALIAVAISIVTRL